MTNENGETKQELLHPDIITKIEALLEKMKISDYKMHTAEGTIKGDNYLGLITRLDIQGKTEDGKPKTLHWIAKSAPTQQTFRELCSIVLVFQREIYMYEKVFQEFLKFQAGKSLTKPFENFAPVYLSCLEEYKECFIMENMKELGYSLEDRKRPLDLEHTLLVMKEYGRYHALSFALKDQKPELFAELAENTKEAFFNRMENRDTFNEAFGCYVDRNIKALDPVTDAVAIGKLEKLKPILLDAVAEVLEPEACGEFGVIGHGDSWMNNMLFKNDANGNPEELIFLDFQLSRIGSPCLDLSYFLFTCTDKPLRDKHFDEFLNTYYDSLCSFLKELGSDPEKCYPREVFEEHMKRFSLYGIVMAMSVLFLMMSESEEVPDYKNMTMDDMLEISSQFSTKNISVFNERSRGMILDVVEKGYL